MKWQDFALRVIVGSAITICFYLTVGFGSLAQLFAIGLAASLGSHAVLLAVRRISGDNHASFLILGACVMVAAGASVFAVIDRAGPPGPLRYRTVDQLMQDSRGNVGGAFRIHGFVEHGSIERSLVNQEMRTRFVMQENGKRVRVELTAPLPDTFRDGAEVVVTGRLRRQRELDEFEVIADAINAKCPSTYNTKDGPRPATDFR